MIFLLFITRSWMNVWRNTIRLNAWRLLWRRQTNNTNMRETTTSNAKKHAYYVWLIITYEHFHHKLWYNRSLRFPWHLTWLHKSRCRIERLNSGEVMTAEHKIELTYRKKNGRKKNSNQISIKFKAILELVKVNEFKKKNKIFGIIQMSHFT